MRKLAIYLLIAFGFFSSQKGKAHDLKLAFFEVWVEEGTTNYQIRADRLKVIEALDYKLSNESLANYLNQVFIVKSANGQSSVQVINYDLTEDYITIRGYISRVDLITKELQIQNRFLMSDDPNHENILRLNLNGRTRSFRFKAERKEISIQYQNT